MPPLRPLITRDPVGGDALIVTRLEAPATGTVIEGHFSLGWIAHLSPEQLAFVGQLLLRRGNVQKLAADLGLAYNTARARLDAIVAALEAAEAAARPPDRQDRLAILRQVADGTLAVEDALRRLSP